MSEKRCFDCKHCGMDMDLDPYCAHPNVLATNQYGSVVNIVRGAPLADDDERGALPHYNLCGPDASLFEQRQERP